MTELEMLANEEARHGNREALERLEAELRGAYLSEMVSLGQAQEAYAAQLAAEARLAKAVEALEAITFECVGDEARCGARAAIAELKGDKE